VHPGDVLRDRDGIHTVHHLDNGRPLVTDWTGQRPHPPADDFTVLWHQHRRTS
jgi:hypothetical protein